MPEDNINAGKSRIIQILNSALEVHNNSNDYQQISFDTSELKAFLTNFISSNEAIVHLSDDMIKTLSSAFESTEENRLFFGNLKFLKGVVEIYKETDLPLVFDEEQERILKELKVLVEKVISKNEARLNMLQNKPNTSSQDHQRLLNIIQREELITADDYDVIAEIVLTQCPATANADLDLIMSYLNDRNAKLLKEIYFGKPASPTNKTQENGVTPPSNVPDLPRNNSQNYNLTDLERNQKIKEILSYLKHNYDNFNEHLLSKLRAVKDLNALEAFAHYLINENPIVYSKLDYGNKEGLVEILTNSSKETIESVLETLSTDHGIQLSKDHSLYKIVRNCTRIFEPKLAEDFLKNSQLFIKYKMPIRTIIDNNISLLITDNAALERTISKLEKYGANIRIILEKCSSILEFGRLLEDGTSLIERNLQIMELYGFDLNAFFADKDSCYTVLCTTMMDTKLDQFIEVGLNEYIHNSPTLAGNNFKVSIIKTVYYAFKNHLQMWRSDSFIQKQLSNKVTKLRKSDDVYPEEVVDAYVPEVNQEMEQKIHDLIENSDYLATDEEIELMKQNHPILEQIDEGYRPVLFSNSKKSVLTRNTELEYGTQKISRRKFFRVFKVLIEKGIDLKTTLLYALTYNTILQPSEFDYIKDEIDRIGVGQNDRLSKAI